MVYHESEIETKQPAGFYPAYCCELRLLAHKADSYREASSLSLAEATAEVKHVRRELRCVRFLIRCIAYACELTGWQSIDWGTAKVTQRGTYPKQEYTAVIDGQKVKRVVWTENVAF